MMWQKTNVATTSQSFRRRVCEKEIKRIFIYLRFPIANLRCWINKICSRKALCAPPKTTIALCAFKRQGQDGERRRRPQKVELVETFVMDLHKIPSHVCRRLGQEADLPNVRDVLAMTKYAKREEKMEIKNHRKRSRKSPTFRRGFVNCFFITDFLSSPLPRVPENRINQNTIKN